MSEALRHLARVEARATALCETKIGSIAVIGADRESLAIAGMLHRAGLDIALVGEPERGGPFDVVDPGIRTLDSARDADLVIGPTAALDLPDARGTRITTTPHITVPGAIGLHLAPMPGARLAEITRIPGTPEDAVRILRALALRLGRVPIVTKAPGIADRLLARYHRAAEEVFLHGSTPWEVDEAMRAFGFPVGPFEAQDLIGLPRVRDCLARHGSGAPVPLMGRMLELGKIGKIAGAGWYRYPGGGGTVEDPIVADLAIEEAYFGALPRTDYAPGEIRERIVFALITEAAAILGEGACIAADLDLASIHALGFPRERGGIVHHAGALGAGGIVERMEGLGMCVPAALRTCAETGTRLSDL